MRVRETLEEVRRLAALAKWEAEQGNIPQARIYTLVGIEKLESLPDSINGQEAEALAFLLRAFLWSMDNR